MAASGSGRDNENRERATRRAPKPTKPLHHNARSRPRRLPVGDALLVGEGIETALSLVAAVPALPAAALSAGSLTTSVPAAGRLARLLIAADLLTGASRGPEWHQVYRALDHGKARSACRQQGVMRTFPMEVHSFAEAFVELQKARQQADYAHEGQYSKLRVLAMIGAAEDAIVQFEQSEARHRRSFAVHVLFKRRP